MKTVFSTLLLILIINAAMAATVTKQKLLIELFSQPGCQECIKIKTSVFPQLKKQYKGKYIIIEYDISHTDNFLKLVAYQDKFDPELKINKPVTVVVDKRFYLCGYDMVHRRLGNSVQLALKNKPHIAGETPQNRKSLKSHLKHFSFIAVAVAGIIDGVNPCVFSTMVFFLSLLSTLRAEKRKVLLVGTVYVFANFITYLFLGFGIFQALAAFSHYNAIKIVIDWTMTVALLIMALLSFADAWSYRKNQRAGQIRLQLPDTVKKMIHHSMKKALKYRYLLPGIFTVGVLVTLLSSICTGQIYLPTLVMMTKTDGAVSKWFIMLLLYNLMFIVPLVILFILFITGTTTGKLINYSKQNVVISKTAMGIFFIALALLIFIIN